MPSIVANEKGGAGFEITRTRVISLIVEAWAVAIAAITTAAVRHVPQSTMGRAGPSRGGKNRGAADLAILSGCQKAFSR